MITPEARHGLGSPDGSLTELEAAIWDNAIADNEVFDASRILEDKKSVADQKDDDYNKILGGHILSLRINGYIDGEGLSMSGEDSYDDLCNLAYESGNRYLVGKFETAKAFREKLIIGQAVYSRGVTYTLTDVPEIIPEGVTEARVTPYLRGSQDNSAPGAHGIDVRFMTWGKEHDGEVKPFGLSSIDTIGTEAISARLDQRLTEITSDWDYKHNGSYRLITWVIQNYETIGQPEKAEICIDIATNQALSLISNTDSRLEDVISLVGFLRNNAPVIYKSVYDKIAKDDTEIEIEQRVYTKTTFVKALVRLDDPSFDSRDRGRQHDKYSAAFAEIEARRLAILKEEQGETKA